MIINKIKILFTVLIVVIFISETKANVLVKYKINEEIITNIDINNEKNYLIALNNQLQNLDEKKVKKIAINSIVREKIKKIELLKYFVLNQESPRLDDLIKNLYLKKYSQDFLIDINIKTTNTQPHLNLQIQALYQNHFHYHLILF